ncbi:MAG: GerMN domain-containing protein [Eubacteriales bacterium]|nr:GerMN domain-containing protein [Eubacteriales bacterium]
MHISGKARRMYLLAAALVVLAVVAACVASGQRRDSVPADNAPATPDPAALPTPQAVPTVPGQSVADVTETMSTIVYYQDNYGYLVPVEREIPLEDGIAKATLNLMVKSLYNDMEAARLGLKTVLPENTQIELDIAGGVAKLDLSDEATMLTDAQSESVMVSAIVQTLTEFDTVDSVRITVEGQELSKLPNGTPIAGVLTRKQINLESTALEPDGATPVTLYFPAGEGSLLVPVTRMVYGSGDIDTAVLELAKGPRASGQLENALPGDVGLIGVKVVDGVAIVNFTGEFMKIVEQSDGGRMALRALMLTCAGFEGVDGVRVLVDGEDYDPGIDTMAFPESINDYESVLSCSISLQAAALFE